MNNEYRIIPPPEMARLMYEGKTLEFGGRDYGYWAEDKGFVYEWPAGTGEPMQSAWRSPCRIKQEPKREFNLKPFDRVLVRNDNRGEWWAALFSHPKKRHHYPWVCVGAGSGNYIAPYKGNERYLGTTDDIPGSWGPEDANEPQNP